MGKYGIIFIKKTMDESPFRNSWTASRKTSRQRASETSTFWKKEGRNCDLLLRSTSRRGFLSFEYKRLGIICAYFISSFTETRSF